MRCSPLILLLPGVPAFELPFGISQLFSAKVVAPLVDIVLPSTPRVAIIGAGAGGSSAAFWISKAKERFGVDVEVDVYESSDYVGGRSTVVYPFDDKSLPEVEIGASIFVKVNKNLWRASEEFNFTRVDFVDKTVGHEIGFWDGGAIVLNLSGGWRDTLTVLWRFGVVAPTRASGIVKKMVKHILTLYHSSSPKWDNISDLANSLEWKEHVNLSTADYFQKYGVSEQYVNLLIQAFTRINYGQNVDSIHALGGSASMATDEAKSVAGGNFKIFESFLNYSGANVYLKTPVTSIAPSSSHSWSLTSSRGTTNYKAVILAAPFHSTGITVPSSISDQIPEQPYVHLHVTLISTTSPSANPAYFGLKPGTQVPRVILTTKPPFGKEPEFNSLAYLKSVREGEWVVKIFSAKKLSDEWLSEMFQGQVGWTYRKEWDAYPKLTPTDSFPPVKLDRGFYYVNALEPFISTMETETISSRNVVDLLLNDEFNASICGRSIAATSGVQEGAQTPFSAETKESEDFVFGFDC